jgi:prepilin-type N-terminal cleavage/methylation domain-containing protein/prepilin-type processing-associated H-X9-DG protein
MYKKFTLIELLVVVTIISILLSMLLPALKNAREAAKTAVCLSNQKQIGIAVVNYSLSFDDKIPAANAFNDQLVDSQVISAPRKSPYTGDIDVDVTKEISPFKCPSGLSDRLSTNILSGKWEYINRDETLRPWRSAAAGNYLKNVGGIDSWYGIVATISKNGGTGEWRYNNWPVYVASYTWPNILGISGPSKALMLHDGNSYMHTYAGNIPGRISPRHKSGKTTNLLFYDGHAVQKAYSPVINSRRSTPDSGNDIVWKSVK